MLTPKLGLAVIVTVVVALDETPKLSVAVAFTVYVPAFPYWCEAEGPAITAPSPKSMLVEEIVVSDAEVAFTVDVTVAGAVPVVGDAVTLTVGGWCPGL